jgi:hypothetical protein
MTTVLPKSPTGLEESSLERLIFQASTLDYVRTTFIPVFDKLDNQTSNLLHFEVAAGIWNLEV